MITRTFNCGRYLYDYNEHGDRTLASLVRCKAKYFNDEDAIACANFIVSEIPMYKSYFMQMKTFSLFEDLIFETMGSIKYEAQTQIIEIERTSANYIAEHIKECADYIRYRGK